MINFNFWKWSFQPCWLVSRKKLINDYAFYYRVWGKWAKVDTRIKPHFFITAAKLWKVFWKELIFHQHSLKKLPTHQINFIICIGSKKTITLWVAMTLSPEKNKLSTGSGKDFDYMTTPAWKMDSKVVPLIVASSSWIPGLLAPPMLTSINGGNITQSI